MAAAAVNVVADRRTSRRLRIVQGHVVAAAPGELRRTQIPPPPARYTDPDKGTLNVLLGHNRWFFYGKAQGAYSGPADCGPDMDIGRLVAAVRQEGFVIIRNALPTAWVDACSEAFVPRLRAHIQRIGENDPKTRNRGPFRHFMDVPCCQPFVGITGCDVAIAVVRELLGQEVAVGGLASDTPLGVPQAGGRGSVYQGVHWCAHTSISVSLSVISRLDAESDSLLAHSRMACRDGTGLNDLDVPPECYLNWPLTDIDDENGPFEMAPGTQRLVGQCRTDGSDRYHPELAEAHRQISTGMLPLRRLHMRKGDLMIRDPRCLHRASPNLSSLDRPMLVAFFLASVERAKSRWNFCPGMTRSTADSLSKDQKRLLRAIRVVDEANAHASVVENGYKLY